jgi:hypothetical protein
VAVPEKLSVAVPATVPVVWVVFEQKALSVSPLGMNVNVKLNGLPIPPVMTSFGAPSGAIDPPAVREKLLTLPVPIPTGKKSETCVVVCAPAVTAKAINAAKHITHFMFLLPLLGESIF